MLVILALMAAVGVSGMNGYIRHAKQVARDSVARTVFMAAQTALTHAYNQDREYYLHNFNPEIPGPDYTFLPEGEAEKQGHAPKPALVYLKLDKGSGNEETPLYKMLAPYINDKAILLDSILIEFNRETGMMLSAFYSEMDGVTFGYGTSGSYDVRGRDDTDARENALVGFYGVDGTGEVIRVNPINADDYKVQLVDYINYQAKKNYGLLTAEIEMPFDAAEISQWTFALALVPAEGAEETITFSWNNAGTDFRIQDLQTAPGEIDTAAEAIQSPREIGTNETGVRRIPVYCERTATRRNVVIILDGVQSLGSQTDIGIRTNFPKIEGGSLNAVLTITDMTDSEILYSEDYSTVPVHALYGGNSEGTSMRIQSVRHLNNIRYCHDASTFTQEQSVYMRDYAGEPLNFTPLCNRFDTFTQSDGETGYGFLGKYKAERGCVIYDLAIDLTKQTSLPSSLSARMEAGDTSLYDAGLFDTVRHGASVEGVRFAASEPVTGEAPTKLLILRYANDEQKEIGSTIALVKGVRYAGGIAAVNEGTITKCTMLGCVTADLNMNCAVDGAAGGIVGSNNNGSISQCASLCAVSGNQYAGGIAGMSTGTVSRCEAGTASWRSAEDPTLLYLSGMPTYGATGDAPAYAGGTHTANNTYRVKIEQDNGAAGGIVGYVSGANAKVNGCVNACKVEAGNEINGEGAHTGGMAGGIAGGLSVPARDYIAIGWNYNAGAVYATGYAGGIVGSVTCGAISYCYNTGYVDWEFEALVDFPDDITYYLPGVSRNIGGKPNCAGGLLGTGGAETTITDCYSMQYTGDAYGGAFGILHKDATVTNCSFQLNILNNTREYYVTKSDAITDALNQLRIYSVKNLRKAPSDANLDSRYFADGNFINPVGVFRYKFPILTQSVDGALPTHRTPWRPSIERFGEISFTSGSVAISGKEIICAFYLAPPEGKIVLRSDAGAIGNKEMNMTVIPLRKQKGFNSLSDLRAAPGVWHDIYGYTTENSAFFTEDYRNYTLQVRAVKLNAANEDDSERIAAGFTHRYELRLYNGVWHENDPAYHTAIPEDATYLVAELYNDHKSANNGYVDDAYIGANNALQMVDPKEKGQSGVLMMNIGRVVDAQSARVTFTYDDGLYQTKWYVYLRADMLNNAPSTYDGALDSTTARASAMGGGGGNSPFPFYMKYGAIYLILWTEDEDVDRIKRPMANLPQWAKTLVQVELLEPGYDTIAWERGLDGWGAPQ